MATNELIVVKYGSNSVVGEHGIDQTKINGYADQLAKINDTHGLVVVTSGSIATGRALWRERFGEDFEESDQPFAMLGSAGVVTAWQEAFARHNVLAGQLLITHREIDDETEGWSLQQVLENNLAHSLITIANENDALSNQEIAELAYGADNDGLASHIARALGSSRLCLMTKKNGLFDEAGNTVPFIPFDETSHVQARQYAGKRDKRGQGMPAKVDAAIDAAVSGIDVYIASASEDFGNILAGTSGTHFVANPEAV